MRKLVRQIAFTASALLSFSTLSSAAEKSVVSMVCSEFPPAKMQSSPDGKLGHDVDILLAALKNSDFQVKILYQPWKRAVESVKSGAHDGLCSCSYRPEREDWLDYSDIMGMQQVGFFYNPDSPIVSEPDLNKIRQASIGVIRSYNLHKELIDENRNAVPVNSAKSGLQMLIEKRIGSFFSFRNTAEYTLSKLDGGEPIKYVSLRQSPYYACFGKASGNSKKLRDQFNLGLRTIIYTGEYEKILQSYK